MFRLFVLLGIVAIQTTVLAQVSSGGNTAANPSSWTIDSLKSHYDQLLLKDAEILALHKEISALNDKHAAELRAAADVRYDQRFNAQEAASTYTRTIQNEFRASLNDLSNTKVPRTEFDAALKAISGQIDGIGKVSSEKLDAVLKNNTAAFTDIQHRLDLKEGSSQGSNALVGNTSTLLVAISAVIGCIFLFVTRNRKQTTGR
jgi:hypothetical protein